MLQLNAQHRARWRRNGRSTNAHWYSKGGGRSSGLVPHQHHIGRSPSPHVCLTACGRDGANSIGSPVGCKPERDTRYSSHALLGRDPFAFRKNPTRSICKQAADGLGWALDLPVLPTKHSWAMVLLRRNLQALSPIRLLRARKPHLPYCSSARGRRFTLGISSLTYLRAPPESDHTSTRMHTHPTPKPHMTCPANVPHCRFLLHLLYRILYSPKHLGDYDKPDLSAGIRVLVVLES